MFVDEDQYTQFSPCLSVDPLYELRFPASGNLKNLEKFSVAVLSAKLNCH